jgi:DNA-binding NtrC family response regulator
MQQTERPASILIVDDEEVIRELLKIYLGDTYDCSTVGSAEDAIERLESRSFDLVVTDITLPGLSGLELCGMVKASHPQTAVVVVSALTASHFARKAKQQGAYQFIQKPFDLADLGRVVGDALHHQTMMNRAAAI